jgi:hypothetical protein
MLIVYTHTVSSQSQVVSERGPREEWAITHPILATVHVALAWMGDDLTLPTVSYWSTLKQGDWAP